MKKWMFIVLLTVMSLAVARDWYVSPEGKGRRGTLVQPAADLGNIVHDLEARDRIFIAAGTYTGRGDTGHDLITVAVELEP